MWDDPRVRGPVIKLDRAHEHIKDFEVKFKAWKDSGPYEIYADLNPEGTEQVVKIRRRSSFPEVLICIAADAIHNLRTALDQIAFILARDIVGCTKKAALREVYFPVGKDRKRFEDFVCEREKDGSFSVAVADLFRTFEPYPGGHGEAIFTLRELDNIDKHRSIIDLRSVDILCIRKSQPAEFCWFDLADKEEVEIAREPTGTKPDYDAKVKYNVVFDQVAGLKQLPLRSLSVFRERTTNVIEATLKTFFP